MNYKTHSWYLENCLVVCEETNTPTPEVESDPEPNLDTYKQMIISTVIVMLGPKQVVPKYASKAYWLIWIKVTVRNRWFKTDTLAFLSVSLKAGNKPAMWKVSSLYQEVKKMPLSSEMAIQGQAVCVNKLGYFLN